MMGFCPVFLPDYLPTDLVFEGLSTAKPCHFELGANGWKSASFSGVPAQCRDVGDCYTLNSSVQWCIKGIYFGPKWFGWLI